MSTGPEMALFNNCSKAFLHVALGIFCKTTPELGALNYSFVILWVSYVWLDSAGTVCSIAHGVVWLCTRAYSQWQLMASFTHPVFAGC